MESYSILKVPLEVLAPLELRQHLLLEHLFVNEFLFDLSLFHTKPAMIASFV